MTDASVVIIGSFLLAFKAILIEGSEVAIISLSMIKQLGRRNIFFGVAVGALGSIVTFLVVETIFTLVSKSAGYIVDFATAGILLYFSYRFLRGFVKYAFRHGSFRAKMARMEEEAMLKAKAQDGETIRSFSVAHSVPVTTITLTEGFEASLILAAAGTFNLEWTIIGALVSLLLLIGVSAVSYQYLLRVPRWSLDLIAGVVLLTFGIIFLATGILTLQTGTL